jgi:hypothetical protein
VSFFFFIAWCHNILFDILKHHFSLLLMRGRKAPANAYEGDQKGELAEFAAGNISLRCGGCLRQIRKNLHVPMLGSEEAVDKPMYGQFPRFRLAFL